MFFPVLGGGFLIWDDNVNLLSNPALWQSEGAWRWMLTDLESVQRYKPINWLLWRWLGNSFGLNPVIFHVVNLVLHVGNAVLLFYVAQSFLCSRDKLRILPLWTIKLGAAVGSLVWALHPLRVEPVAWISGVGYPLCTFFGLLAVLVFQHYLRGERALWHRTAFVLFVVSLLCYPAAASLPALLLVLSLMAEDPHHTAKFSRLRAALRHLAPYVLCSALLLGLTLLTRLNASGEIWHRPTTLADAGLLTRIGQAFAVWMWYLQKTLLPLNLSPVYVEFRDFSVISVRAAASLSMFIFLAVMAWRRHRMWPEAGPLSLAFLTLAIPVLGITDMPFTPSDRYTYVPSLALALLLASGIARVIHCFSSPAHQTATLVVTSLSIVALGFASTQQLAVWRSPITFFQHALAGVGSHPAAADLHWRLGLHHLMADDPYAAIVEFRSVLRIDAKHEDAARYLRVLESRHPNMSE
ncbi:MAG TPA: hypothetical protein PLF88_00125 [Opitutaceae bacterium]|nr:hypothetical protein [Opitutaceae bacterium]